MFPSNQLIIKYLLQSFAHQSTIEKKTYFKIQIQAINITE